MLFFHVSGHGFELVSKLAVLKQRIKTYCTQPAVQYYLQPGRKGNITDLQTELAKLQQFQRDIDKVLGGGASVEPGSMTTQASSTETCFKVIRQTISTGVISIIVK
jgi:hypothetical protein